MAYDSATDTALAGQAWQKALLAADQRRTALNTGYGLNADGSLDNTDVGHLGSIYQTGLAGEQNYEAATANDRRRGFAGSGGLAGRGRSRARQGALTSQALALREANTQLGLNTQEHDAANQQYEDDKRSIGSRSSWDLAQTLAANPISNPVAPGVANPGYTSISPALAAARQLALKKNPYAAQTARNRF